jgi:hypothetical protein
MNRARVLSNLVWARLGHPWEVDVGQCVGHGGAAFAVTARRGDSGTCRLVQPAGKKEDLWDVAEVVAARVMHAFAEWQREAG